MEKIKEFGKFIEENKAFLTVIGVFAALTNYFFLSISTNEFSKLILKDNILPALTFLLFLFLLFTFIIKIVSDAYSSNLYITLFGLLFFFFTLSISAYFITFFANWVKVMIIIILFFVVITSLGKLYSFYFKNRNQFLFNAIILIFGIILAIILNFLNYIITNDYILYGIYYPFYLSIIFFMIISSTIKILGKLKSFF